MTSGPCELCSVCIRDVWVHFPSTHHGRERKMERREVITHHVTCGGSYRSQGSARSHRPAPARAFESRRPALQIGAAQAQGHQKGSSRGTAKYSRST